MDLDDFVEEVKTWVKILIIFFIISQIISYKVYGPYSLLCWNGVTIIMLLIYIGFGVLCGIGSVIIYSFLWLLDKFEDNKDKKKIILWMIKMMK